MSRSGTSGARPPPGALVANARMYAVNGAAGAAWARLFAHVAGAAGVPLALVAHPAPAPLEALWRRDDLGLAFVCGLPFARGGFPVRAVAAPVPASPLGQGRSLYATDLVVAADSPFQTLPGTFGGRIGWTVEHSQSGFNAPRAHLLPYREGGRALREGGGALYRASVGPLLTPRRVIEAVLDGAVDVGPLDSYVHDLLRRHEPGTAARLRVVATTRPTPMPLLVASAGVDEGTVARLRATLLGLADGPEGGAFLADLALAGFSAVAAADYAELLAQAAAAEAAGYPVPA